MSVIYEFSLINNNCNKCKLILQLISDFKYFKKIEGMI